MKLSNDEETKRVNGKVTEAQTAWEAEGGVREERGLQQKGYIGVAGNNLIKHGVT